MKAAFDMCECGQEHAILDHGVRYEIEADDCCLRFVGSGTFDQWWPSDDGTITHDVMGFEEGFTLGPSWASLGWSFEPIIEERPLCGRWYQYDETVCGRLADDPVHGVERWCHTFEPTESLPTSTGRP